MSVDINNESDTAVDEATALALVRHVMAQTHVHPDASVGVLFVNEDAMTSLHAQWMGDAVSTDVLSFPMDELRPGRPGNPSPEGMLGDIVVCPQVAQRQAENAGHSLEQEIIVLITHGMLHLLGFDHATPAEEAEMFGLQRELIHAFLMSGNR